ncbi:putative membrane protein [Klebsiella oxytoca]|nr:putative membrane protein [Klebsiella oxytoca]
MPFVNILVALALIIIAFYCLVWYTLIILKSDGIDLSIF